MDPLDAIDIPWRHRNGEEGYLEEIAESEALAVPAMRRTEEKMRAEQGDWDRQRAAEEAEVNGLVLAEQKQRANQIEAEARAEAQCACQGDCKCDDAECTTRSCPVSRWCYRRVYPRVFGIPNLLATPTSRCGAERMGGARRGEMPPKPRVAGGHPLGLAARGPYPDPYPDPYPGSYTGAYPGPLWPRRAVASAQDSWLHWVPRRYPRPNAFAYGALPPQRVAGFYLPRYSMPFPSSSMGHKSRSGPSKGRNTRKDSRG